MSLILKGMQWLTFALDQGIYKLVEVAYSVFYYMSNATILNDRVALNITTRVYTLLSIVMVFVLAFNLLNYIIDPDKINDKKIGASAFIKDVVIALVIISMTPMLFTKLYSLQSKIITSGVISNLILGGNAGEDISTREDFDINSGNYDNNITNYYIERGANSMIASVYVAFLYPNDGTTALNCTGENATAPKDYCEAYKKVKNGEESIGVFSDFITHSDYNFTPLLTTVAGIVLLFFMLSFCLNLAKRVGKLAVIQLLAPIPVTLEILPNKKGLRKTWIETLISTYLEVFLYLFIMYLIMFLISLIPDVIGRLFKEFTSEGFNLVKIFTTVMLIYGLLLFAKEAPKLLLDLLGLKSTGTITATAKRATAMGAFTGGLVGSTAGNFLKNYNATDGNFASKFASGVGGASSTITRNLWGARNVHSIKDATKLRNDVNKKVIQNRVNRDGYAHAHFDGNPLHTPFNVAKGHVKDLGRNINLGVRDYIGADNEYQKKKAQESILKQYKKLYSDNVESLWKSDAQWASADSEYNRYKNMIKSGAVRATDIDKMTGKTYQDLRDQAEIAKNSRQLEVIKNKKIEFMEAAGKLNNFIDNNQGVPGVTTDRIELSDIANISTEADAAVEFGKVKELVTGKDINGTVVGSGFETELKTLKDDAPYQQKRIDEKLREDAQQASKKAAEQASKKDDKK